MSIGSIILLLSFFIGRTQYEYKLKTGTIQYAAFGGWQLAANALYGYAFSRQDDPETAAWRYRGLHSLVNHHMDSLYDLTSRPDREIGVYYLWDFKSPLRIYMTKHWNKNKTAPPFFKQWASMAPLYASYGRWLIIKHPWPFIKHYLWPNLVRYYSPPAFFMEKYNLGNKKVDPIVVSWFDWTNDQLPTRAKDRDIHIISIFPNLLAILNPVFLISTLIFLGSLSFRKCNKISKRIITCMVLVWISNAFFSVLSAPIELRYQLFPITITLPFCVLFITQIIQSLQQDSTTKRGKTIPTTDQDYKLTKA